MSDFEHTMLFNLGTDHSETVEEIMMSVYQSLREKGYDPINQIVGYFISGDPTYITSYNNARYMIGRLERDELLEEITRFYIQKKWNGPIEGAEAEEAE